MGQYVFSFLCFKFIKKKHVGSPMFIDIHGYCINSQ